MSQGSELEPDLDKHVGYVLKRAHAALRGEMDAALRPLGMTVPQYACLEALERDGGLSSAQLARATFVTRQSMTVMLAGLAEEGLVEEAPGPHRGKARPYRITSQGHTALRPAITAVRSVEQQMTEALDDTERAELRSLLRACIDGLRESPHD